MYNIHKGKLVWRDIKRMKLSREEVLEYGLKPNDILVNRVNSRELVGKAALIPSGIEQCVFESKNIRLRIQHEDVCNAYVNYWLLFFGQKYFTQNTQQTVGMASINQEQLAAMPIPMPNISEQEMVVGQIERLFSIADELEKCAAMNMMLSQRTKQSILRIAFQGKLVPQNPSDEPASKLLERIKAEQSGATPKGRKPRQTKMF